MYAHSLELIASFIDALFNSFNFSYLHFKEMCCVVTLFLAVLQKNISNWSVQVLLTSTSYDYRKFHLVLWLDVLVIKFGSYSLRAAIHFVVVVVDGIVVYHLSLLYICCISCHLLSCFTELL